MLSSVFAENEGEILLERTLAGMESARARGRVGRRPNGLKKIERTGGIGSYAVPKPEIYN